MQNIKIKNKNKTSKLILNDRTHIKRNKFKNNQIVNSN